ncbi:Serine phosphatase RsbU, regulator of sigma subunit [Streptomyces zhaozhouensis]|uniref:Serine phosphatase RsbU, regulator of sigma subunit n=1 Tax=Streptomyces zhaozhouensis TaxID=1300267 RepID=A0A286DZN2_9ACTN|nr:SpoIIE family protein phosphatase [Streptomyces zhaozhouensis]SOD64128.1 Serine phosphatase RsbU, regulator of sigma subunit [Streptomyces zhaozhouensis]
MFDDAADLIRLGTLAGAEVTAEVELLRLAVQHAVAGTGGLGGFAHLRQGEGVPLRLATVVGLPVTVAGRWDRLPEDSPTAPAAALRDGAPRWAAAWPPGGEPEGSAWGAVERVGVLALPVWGDDGPVGVLSVLTADPPEARRAFLRRLAEVAGERLGSVAHQRPGEPTPWRRPTPTAASRTRSVPVAMWSWDLATGLMEHGPEAAPLLLLAGLDPERWDHRAGTLMARVHPDDRPAVEADVRRAIAERRVLAVEFRVRDTSGHSNWLSLRGQFRFDARGVPTRLEGHSWDITSSHSVLQWLPTLLENHPDPLYTFLADREVIWSNRAANAMAATYAPDRPEDVAGWFLGGRAGEENARAVLDAAFASAGRLVTHEFTAPAAEAPAPRAWRARSGRIGEHIAVQLMDISAQHDAERAAVLRAQQVDRFREAMARAVRARDAAAAVAEHVLPMVGADGLLVYQYQADATELIGSVGYAPERLRELEESRVAHLGRRFPASEAPTFFGSPEELARRRPEIADVVRAGGRQAWFSLPLAVANEKVGHCVLSWNQPHDLGTEESSLLATLGGLLAQSLERGRLFDREHSRAQALREALRPWELPTPVGVTAAARRHPLRQADRFGSWSAALPLPSARTLLISASIGRDGLEAAVAMGQLRTTVSELARLDQPLDELAAQVSECEVVNRLARDPEAPCPTLLLALYDATSGRMDALSAGHPVPLLTSPDGRTEVCRVPVGVPLGASAIPYTTYRTEVAPGSLLCVSTASLTEDGAGERPAPVPAGALEAAAGAPAERALPLLEEGCARVWETLDEPPESGAALLLARLDRLPPGRQATTELPCAPASAGLARRWLTGRLAELGLESLAFVAELSVSELVSNTVRHASGPIRLRLLRLTDRLVVEVYDRSQSAPRLRPLNLLAEEGRGLLLVAQTAEAWGSFFTEDGKCIWIALALEGPGEAGAFEGGAGPG